MHVAPGEICVVQRGMRFRWAAGHGGQGVCGARPRLAAHSAQQARINYILTCPPPPPPPPPPPSPSAAACALICSVALPEGRARGYVLEIFASHFQLPDLGPIGELCRGVVH